MSTFPNPTGLRVGMTGTLSGIRYRVIGRVTLGASEAGQTYYWQEFNVVEDNGRSATLVYEEGENGPEWKLFLLFEPARPMTVAEAANKRVGETLNLEGQPVEITYIGRSRVYDIEGTAPEGVEIGDVAEFINADQGTRMLVVSWTGNEIEYYRGIDVPTHDVTRAFGLVAFTSTPSYEPEEEEPSSISTMFKVIGVMILAIVGYFVHSEWATSRRLAAIQKKPTNVAYLIIGTTVSLAGTSYTAAGHTTVEIARPGSRYNWHEYHLQDAAGERASLVGGMNVGSNQWFLFRPVNPDGLLTARQAAALRVGDPITIQSHKFRVIDLFQCRSINREGTVPTIGEFGLLALANDDQAIVRWSETAIEYFVGRQVPEKDVLAAFPASKN